MWRFVLMFLAFFMVQGSALAVCDFHSVKLRAVQLVSGATPQGKGEAVYTQHLVFGSTKSPLPSRKDFSYRELPIAMVHKETCEVKWVIESRRIEKGSLSLPLGGHFDLAPRAFGPIWNDFNTQLQNEKWVAVVMKWRRFDGGPTVYYVPYSKDLVETFPDLAEEGKRHFLADMNEALSNLLRLGLINSNDEALLHGVLPMLFASESIDPYEFKASDGATRLRLLDQPFVTLGANGKDAYALKVSSAGAKGLMQIWGPSCGDLRKLFPKAELSEDCTSSSWGDHGHVGNISAGALAVKMHLGRLKHRFGPKIVDHPELLRMLSASYNGGPGWVIKAYREHGRKWDEIHFTKVIQKKKGKKAIKKTVVASNSLRPETVDYLKKTDFLNKNAEQLRPRMQIGGAR